MNNLTKILGLKPLSAEDQAVIDTQSALSAAEAAAIDISDTRREAIDAAKKKAENALLTKRLRDSMAGAIGNNLIGGNSKKSSKRKPGGKRKKK